MLANLTAGLDFHSKALVLRAQRQGVIASNIANADTPGFAARDINFKESMSAANSSSLALDGLRGSSTNPAHMATSRQQLGRHGLRPGPGLCRPEPAQHGWQLG